MPSDVQCDLCHRALPAHESFIVRTEVFADPSMPPVTSQALSAGNFEQTIADLLDQMQHMTADQLQDGVHRRFEFRLCPTCHRRFLANPLGKPRGEARASAN